MIRVHAEAVRNISSAAAETRNLKEDAVRAFSAEGLYAIACAGNAYAC